MYAMFKDLTNVTATDLEFFSYPHPNGKDVVIGCNADGVCILRVRVISGKGNLRFDSFLSNCIGLPTHD